MDPFGIVATGLCVVIGGSIVTGELLARRSARRLLPVVEKVPRVNARRRRGAVLAERLGPFGTTAFSVKRTSIDGTVLRVVHGLETLPFDFALDLAPAERVSLEKMLAGLALPPSKADLPPLTGREDARDLMRNMDEAWPIIEQGIYPLISGNEAAWLIRMLLHPAADATLRRAVATRCHDVKTSKKADEVDLDAWLAWAGGGPVPPEAEPTVALHAAHAAVRALRGGRVLRAGLRDGGLLLELELANEPDTEQISRTLDEAEHVIAALVPAHDGAARCPACGDVPLTAPGDAGACACPRCAGKLLSPEDARTTIYEPLGKSPGELKDAAKGAGKRERCCPLCRGQMAPVFLDEAIIDICPACGAAWLDEGELDALSFGRYRG